MDILLDEARLGESREWYREPLSFVSILRMYTAKNVGAGLLAKAVYQSSSPVTGTPHSQANPP
ncbi:hypothetical protein ACW9I3_29675, partial [Pseudomonas pergaminensis]